MVSQEAPPPSPRHHRWSCEVCAELFLFQGRHHCRRCGSSVCGQHFQRPYCSVCTSEVLQWQQQRYTFEDDSHPLVSPQSRQQQRPLVSPQSRQQQRYSFQDGSRVPMSPCLPQHAVHSLPPKAAVSEAISPDASERIMVLAALLLVLLTLVTHGTSAAVLVTSATWLGSRFASRAVRAKHSDEAPTQPQPAHQLDAPYTPRVVSDASTSALASPGALLASSFSPAVGASPQPSPQPSSQQLPQLAALRAAGQTRWGCARLPGVLDGDDYLLALLAKQQARLSRHPKRWTRQAAAEHICCTLPHCAAHYPTCCTLRHLLHATPP